jgi:GT2 family glycosyltransferase
MSRVPTLDYRIDHPVDWVPTQSDLEVRGWLSVGPGAECRDLRAVVDGVIFYGICGLDCHAQPAATAPAGGNGFRVRTRVWAGARTLSLEYLDGSNQWQPFASHPLDSARLIGVRRPRPQLRAALVFDSLHLLYQQHRDAHWSSLCRAADAILASITSFSTDLAAEGSFRGHLENPGPWIGSSESKLRVSGWAFAPGQTIRQLSARVGGARESRLSFGQDRPDVAAHFPTEPAATRSGFSGLVDLASESPGPVCLRIFATLTDGTRQLVFARRLHLDRSDGQSGGEPGFAPFDFARCTLAFFRSALLGRVAVDNWRQCRAEARRLRRSLSGSPGPARPAPAPPALLRRSQQDPYSRWAWHNRLTPSLTAILTAEADQAVAAGGPLISVVVPAYNTPEPYLLALLACLRAQLYPRWELCIADDASPHPHVRRLLTEAAHADPRIKPVFRPTNGHIAHATNSALEVATGEFVALVDHDDLLPRDALLHIAQAVLAHPTVGYLYTDEDKVDDSGHHYDPQFKGDWSPEMAITHNYTHHLSVIRRSVVTAVGGLRPEFNGAQDLDLFLRCFERLASAAIVHVPFVCYHWRAHAESTAARGDQKGYLFDAARLAIAEACTRRGLRATPVLPPLAQQYALCLHQLQWDPALLRENPVTIVIPTRNRADRLARCLASLARTTPPDSVRLLVVDDGSDEPAALALLAGLPTRTDRQCRVVTAPPSPGAGFDHSRLLNLGAAQADTPLLLLLSPDVEALQPGWLEDLVGWACVPGVGIVGPKLLYPDGTINSAGLGLGRADSLPHTLFAHTSADDLGYVFLPHAARNVAAVSGACLLTRTALHRELGGFDAQSFPGAYNDADYCLRAARLGWRTVFTPQAVLQGDLAPACESANATAQASFTAAHGGARDPYLAEALDLPPPRLALNPHHHRQASLPRPFHAIVFTPGLEAVPSFLFELVHSLAAQPGVSLRLVSPTDGPLRPRFEQAGLSVQIVDTAPIFAAPSPDTLAAAIGALARTHDWSGSDLFVCLTLGTFWAVHLARHLGLPSLLTIHDSTPVAEHFARLLPAATRESPAEAVREATRVVFTDSAARQAFEGLEIHDNFRTLAPTESQPALAAQEVRPRLLPPALCRETILS